MHVTATSVESAERVELLQERDELARELAEVKHRERRRVHGSKGGKKRLLLLVPRLYLEIPAPAQTSEKPLTRAATAI